MKYCSTVTNFLASFVFCVIFCIKEIYASKTLSPSMLSGSLGNWGPVDECPEGTYVRGFQLKIEPMQNSEDDNTAINGIRFSCGRISEKEMVTTEETLDIKNKTGEKLLSSFVGPWGEWGKMHHCSENQYAIGFQMNSQIQNSSRFLKSDRSGVTNFRLICSSPGNSLEVIEGKGMDWGSWTNTLLCDKLHVICSIQTKVHVSIQDPTLKNCWHRDSNRTVDQQALTDMKTDCCQPVHPSQTCVPSESWHLVEECDNSGKNFHAICTYSRTIGLSHDLSSPNIRESNFEAYHFLGFDMKIISSYLDTNFKSHFKSKSVVTVTDISWEDFADNEIWDVEKSEAIAFDLPPGYKTRVYQLVGNCGFYLVKSSRFQRMYSVIRDEQEHAYVFDEFSNSTAFNMELEIFKRLNESIIFDLGEEESEIIYSAGFLIYLIVGVILGPIIIGFSIYFILKFCIKSYTDEDLITSSAQNSTDRLSTSPVRDSSLVIKNMGTGTSSIEMERF